MKILNGVTIAGLTIVALTLGSTDSLGQDECDHGGNHTIQVRAGDDGVRVLKYRGGSADEVHVCVGDRVQWVLTGSDREFLVDFLSGAPFEGATHPIVTNHSRQTGGMISHDRVCNWRGGWLLAGGVDPVGIRLHAGHLGRSLGLRYPAGCERTM